MSDRNAILEALAKAILGKTAPQAAAAVLELVGPRPLVFWTSDTGDLVCDTLFGRYQIQKGGARWCCMYAMGNKRRPKGDDAPTFHKSEESAQAAAQAHADAAHWANTALGAMIGGE